MSPLATQISHASPHNTGTFPPQSRAAPTHRAQFGEAQLEQEGETLHLTEAVVVARVQVLQQHVPHLRACLHQQELEPLAGDHRLRVVTVPEGSPETDVRGAGILGGAYPYSKYGVATKTYEQIRLVCQVYHSKNAQLNELPTLNTFRCMPFTAWLRRFVCKELKIRNESYPP